MADVFISYSSQDRDFAGVLAGALAARGWSVWWDREIIAGQVFDKAIEHEIEAARCVVVLWSLHSVESEWVKNEAAVAADRGVLVPASIDDVRLPLQFRRRQTAALVGWGGDPSHDGFLALCRGIARVVGTGGRPLPSAAPAARRPPAVRRLRVALLAVAAVLAIGVYALFPRSTGPAATKAVAGLADAIVGTYHGDVVSDSRGSSRSNVTVTLSRLDANTVRVSSADARIGTLDIALRQLDGKVFNAGGDSTLIADPRARPVTLALDPRNELAYRGAMAK